MDNPLLEPGGLPPFDRIKPEHIVPALETILADNRASIDRITSETHGDWKQLLLPMEILSDRLNQMWSPVGHLHGVADSEALREAYNTALGLLSDYHSEMSQNQALFRAYRQLADSEQFAQMPVAARRIVDNALRDFHLGGVDLPPERQTEFRAIRQELSRLQTKFEENLLDAGLHWKKHITDVGELEGVPESALALMQQNARRDQLEGWLLNLDFPCYQPLMGYCHNRELRQQVYQAFVTRASDQGPDAGRWDNSDNIHRIMTLRQQQAALLNMENFAEYSLATKMARNTDEVVDFLLDLARRTRPVAEQDLADLTEFAHQQGHHRLEAWDIPYFSERLRQQRYAISQEELRPYFPHTRVLSGLFEVVDKLYGLKVSQQQGVATWHPDVCFFRIEDGAGNLRGQFYLDLFARQHKRGGAWMDECRIRHSLGEDLQHPVAYLTCNFTPPVGDAPVLLTHQEVITLFHEFGHGLHHLLTQVDLPSVSGINGVAWDAVELPSQFMENWCWEREALELISAHHETGEPLSDGLFQRMLAAKNFQSGLFMLRQLELALFDFRLHMLYQPGKTDVQALLDAVRQEVAVVFPPEWNRFQHGFSHIFAGGYAAGYYSYKWAEVLSADAFSLFEENGIFDRSTGLAFMNNILEQGGSRDALELFKNFRGREPDNAALLRHSGITPA